MNINPYDPFLMLLPESVRKVLWEKIHPHVPKVAELAKILQKSSPAEIKEIKQRIKDVSKALRITTEAVDSCAKAKTTAIRN